MPIKLNDLLKLSPEELVNTKIRFCQHNGEADPIELFKRNPNELLGWHYWNSQKYKPGQLAIGVVKMNPEEWLLFTVGRVIKDLKLPGPGVGFEYETLGFVKEKGIDYSDYYGRVVISYHKKMMSQFPNANTVIDDFIIKEILPSQFTGFDFPGYENVSLSFSELETIINGNYPSYKNALEHQQAVYVITDKNTGKLYVGSATSKDKQLLARWKGYITTFDNGNTQLRLLYEKEGADYFRKYFQYSIIENFNANVDYDYIIKRESYWKNVLDTRNHGYNKN
jgi:predicted GIY-YIG superfamily endonuclease